jgi:DNA-binding response OmpR family regulator
MRVLAVEDDTSELEQLAVGLRRLGHEVLPVQTGGEAIENHTNADLVLLKLELPDIDGLDVCRSIRSTADTPVIVITENSSEIDRVLGLQAGADDCMNKPYSMRELTARMEALMRRSQLKASYSQNIQRGALRIDSATRQVSVNGRGVMLTRKEFDLLHVLASEPHRVLSRSELMSRVWQEPEAVAQHSARSSRTLDTHIATLRSKFGAGDWIVTVRGIGFRLGSCRVDVP